MCVCVCFCAHLFVTASSRVNITRAARTPSRQHANFTSHTAAVNAVVTIGTDYVIASASDDITIKVWDLRAGQLLGTLSKTVGQGGGHTQPIKALAYFPMDRLFMSGAVDSDIIAWDTSTVTDVTRMGIIVQAHFSEVLALSSSLSGSQPLLSGGDDHVVKVRFGFFSGVCFGVVKAYSTASAS